MKKIFPIMIMIIALFTFNAVAQRGSGGQGCPMMSSDGQQGDGRMMTSLDLTLEQQVRIEKIRLEFQKDQIALKSKLQIKRIELYEEMLADSNTTTVRRIVREISELQEKMLDNRVRRDLSIRRVLTKEQWLIYARHNYSRGQNKMHGQGQKPRSRGNTANMSNR